jgi:predicted transcriptional regulator
MSEIVERSSLDTRYESHRMRDAERESRLLASIARRGIEEPLSGVDTPEGRLLLNGFKRYRCAQKLGLELVPYLSLGDQAATGIVNLMRVSRDKDLSILEQAKFVVDLLSVHAMSVTDVAESVSRSKAWVSMRRSLLAELSDGIERILFRGDFPVYSYMYTLRQLMRMNSVTQDEIERFMKSMQRVMTKCDDQRLKNRAFHAQANLLTGGLLSQFQPFCERMQEFYDRSGHA